MCNLQFYFLQDYVFLFYEKIYIFLTRYSDQLLHLEFSEGPALKQLQARGKIPTYQNTSTTCANSDKHLLREIFQHLRENKITTLKANVQSLIFT